MLTDIAKREQRVKRVLEQEEKERRGQSRQLDEERAKPPRHVDLKSKVQIQAQTEVKSNQARDSSSSPPNTLGASTIPVFQREDSDSHDEGFKGGFSFADGTIDPSQIGKQLGHDSSNLWGSGYDKTTIFGLQPLPRFVSYSTYNFIDAGHLNQLSHADVSYLTEKGCLTLPSETALDEFFRQYFAHIHPIIPLLSEAEFWASDARIPLLLVRAILFIASPVSLLDNLTTLPIPNRPKANPCIVCICRNAPQSWL